MDPGVRFAVDAEIAILPSLHGVPPVVYALTA
jgi:hypothetical protein